MPDNRCINNPFGYCHSLPQLELEHALEHAPETVEDFKYSYDLSGRCVNNWATCTQFITWQKETEHTLATNLIAQQ